MESPPQAGQGAWWGGVLTTTWRGCASRESRPPTIAPYRNGTAPRGTGGANIACEFCAGVMAVGLDVPIAPPG